MAFLNVMKNDWNHNDNDDESFFGMARLLLGNFYKHLVCDVILKYDH